MASLRDSFSAPGVVQAPQPSLLSSFQLALLAVLSCLAPGCAIAYAIEISIERSSPTYPGEESFGTSPATTFGGDCGATCRKWYTNVNDDDGGVSYADLETPQMDIVRRIIERVVRSLKYKKKGADSCSLSLGLPSSLFFALVAVCI